MLSQGTNSGSVQQSPRSLKETKKNSGDSKQLNSGNVLLKVEGSSKKNPLKLTNDQNSKNYVQIKNEMNEKMKGYESIIKPMSKAEIATPKSNPQFKNVSKSQHELNNVKQTSSKTDMLALKNMNKNTISGGNKHTDSLPKSNIFKKVNQSKNSSKNSASVISPPGNTNKKINAKSAVDSTKSCEEQCVEIIALKKEVKEKAVKVIKSKNCPKSDIKKALSASKECTVSKGNCGSTATNVKNKAVVVKNKKIKNENKFQLSANYSKNRRVHRMASLNALAKVHILYENESRGSPSDGSETEICPADSLTDASMDTVSLSSTSCDTRKRSNSETLAAVSSSICLKTEIIPKIKKSKKEDTSSCCSSSSGSDSRTEIVKPKVKKNNTNLSKKYPPRPVSPQRTKNSKVKKKELIKAKHVRKRKIVSDVEIIDTKNCKRLACLNAQAILAASYSPERSRKVSKSLANCKLDEITTYNQKEIMTFNHEIVTDQSITTQVNHQTCTTFIRQKQNQKPTTTTALAKQTSSLQNVIKKATTGTSGNNQAVEQTRLGTVKSDPCTPTTGDDTKNQHVCKVRTQETMDNDQTNCESIRKVGVTAEYTEVTKVHINTTKEMQLKEELGKAKRRTIERITEKDDVAITRMYRYQTKGTSQSYCVKMHTTFKPGSGNKGLISEPPPTINHQAKNTQVVDGVPHTDGHPTGYYNYNHPVVPGEQNFTLNHSQSGSVGRVNGVPVVSVSPMVRHYGGSAFSVPHYGASPTANTHNQHNSMPYNQMDYSYYPPVASGHDPQCLIHKPVPYHPQQSPTHQHSSSQVPPLHPPHAHQISSSPSCVAPNLPPHPPPAHSSYSPSVPQDPYLMTSHNNSCSGLERISPLGGYQTQAAMSPHHQLHLCQNLPEGGHSPSQKAPSAHQYRYHQRSPVRINPPVSYSPNLNMPNSPNVPQSPMYHCQNRGVQPQRCIYSPPNSNIGVATTQSANPQHEYSTAPTYTVLSPVPMGSSQTPQQRLISQQVKKLVGGSRNTPAITKTEPITPPEVITIDSQDAFSTGINDSYYNSSSYPTDMSVVKCKQLSESPVIVDEIDNGLSIPVISSFLKTPPSSSRDKNHLRNNSTRDESKLPNKDGPAWNLRTPNQAQVSPIYDLQTSAPVITELKHSSQTSSKNVATYSEKNVVRESNRRLRGTTEASLQSVRTVNSSQRRKTESESEGLPTSSIAPIVSLKKNVQIDKKAASRNTSVKDKPFVEHERADYFSLVGQVHSSKKAKRNVSGERNSSSERPEVIKCEEQDDKNKSKSSDLAVSPFNSMIKKKLAPKKFSNGWSWEGEPFEKLVFLSNDDPPCLRRCYPAMRHMEGDIVKIRDCVLLKSGPRKIDLPFVAKVAALWETPEDGEMMISLLWYYRPEHTDQGRRPADLEDEIFASKHRDVNSVACIEDKCYVLTFAEYCRYKKRIRMFEESYHQMTSVVPQPDDGYNRRIRLPPGRVSPEMVFVCRKVYDFRQKRLLKNPV